MSIEAFFLINLLMDFAIIAAATFGLGRFRLAPALAASLIAAGYASVACGWLPGITAWPFQLLLLMVISALVLGVGNIAATGLCALSLTVATAFTGTCASIVCRAVGFQAALGAGLGGTLLACVQMRANRAWQHSGTLHICAVCGDVNLRFEALIDSGNRLREPFSGQPVLILAPALAARLPKAQSVRQVAYGSVGGSGSLDCFKPDAIYIYRGRKRALAPPAWIAACPNRLPGGISALAPPELTAI